MHLVGAIEDILTAPASCGSTHVIAVDGRAGSGRGGQLDHGRWSDDHLLEDRGCRDGFRAWDAEHLCWFGDQDGDGCVGREHHDHRDRRCADGWLDDVYDRSGYGESDCDHLVDG